MNKKVFITIICAIISISALAQTIKVEYENQMNSLPNIMQQYLQIQGIQHMQLTIKGKFNGQRAKIKSIRCHNGTFTEHKLLPDYVHFVLLDSIETLDFMAVPFGTDSLRISCFYPIMNNMLLFKENVRIDKMKTIMEVLTPGDGPDTPILAYSSGIPIEGGTWFCGLIDSGIEPRRWNEKYGIDDYVYYTITLEDDTPKSKNETIYIKITKD